MNEVVMKLENITDEKFNEMLSTGWKLISVDRFENDKLIYSFSR